MSIEILNTKIQRKKEWGKNEYPIIWDNMKSYKICVIQIPEEKGRYRKRNI